MATISGIKASSINTDFLVDELGSDAAYAFSLRRLRAGYTGNAIQVKRTSDNTTSNIGFTSSGGLDTTALTNFVGASTGYISTWYDQSGNGRDVINTGADSTKPIIITSGTLHTSGLQSRPAIKFIRANSTRLGTSSAFTTIASVSSAGETFIIVVQETNTLGVKGCTIGHGNDSDTLRYGAFLPYLTDYTADLGSYIGRRVSVAEPAGIAGVNNRIIIYDDGISDQKIISNDTTLVTTSNTSNTSGVDRILYIGAWGSLSDVFFDGFIQEAIVWNKNKKPLLSRAQNNINNYYQ
jgi:hypothetical protein